MTDSLIVDLREPLPEIKVSFAGEIDIATSPKVNQRLTSAFEAQPARILVDLSAVSFIDSIGLGVLVNARTRARNAGVELKLILPVGKARFPFEITGLASVFDTIDSATHSAS